MRITVLLCGFLLVSGCDSVSLDDILAALPTDGDSLTNTNGEGSTNAGDDPATASAGDGEILLCVFNLAETNVSYRVGEVNGAVSSSALDAGAGECFSASCGVDVGIDQIQSATFSSATATVFPGSDIPCGATVRIEIANDGSVQGFIDTTTVP